MTESQSISEQFGLTTTTSLTSHYISVLTEEHVHNL